MDRKYIRNSFFGIALLFADTFSTRKTEEIICQLKDYLTTESEDYTRHNHILLSGKEHCYLNKCLPNENRIKC